jgi:chromosome partitioning protein
MDTKIIAVCNYKGGSGKTTTAVYLAHSYHAQGLTVLIVDADPKEHGSGWADQAGFEIPMVKMAEANVHTKIMDKFNGYYDVIVIDTPADDGAHKLVRNPMRIADIVVVPVQASGLDLAPIQTTLEEVELFDKDYAIVLNRGAVNSTLVKDARTHLQDQGLNVLSPAIPSRNDFMRAYFDGVSHRMHGYDLIADQVMERIATNG